MIRGYFRFVTDSDRSLVWRLLVAGLGLAGAGALALAVTLAVLIPLTPGTEDLEHLKVQKPTVVKGADGETIAEFGRLNRDWVPISEIDTTVVQALVATEDHRFYEHPGVDFKRLAGAVFRSALGNLQGGSTLTMQLTRNLYPDEIGQAFGPLRKLKEIVTAFKIERAYSKGEIIETYLNTMPFLYGAHGIERGAQMYFDTSAAELEPEEAAMLIGMLKATAYYNPHRNPERARARRNVVLSQMEKRGVITAEEYEELKEAPLDVDFSLPPARPESEAPHFTEQLRDRLLRWAEERGYNIYTDGLIVHATLNPDLQAMAQKAARRQGAALQAVANVEWGRESGDLLSQSAAPYRQAQSGVEGFGYFWEQEEALVEDFIQGSERFRRLTSAGQSEAAVLEELRADAAFIDSLREVKTRLEVGFVAIEPDGAEVRAYVGSRDFDEDQYDHAGIARRQPGSTFKPFVYATALKEGHRPDDTFEDTPVEIRTASGETWRPENAGGASTGEQVSLSDGLVYSKNTITSRVVKEVGAGDVARTARDMGVRRSDLEEVPSLALGTSSVTLLEMASAYATLARGGRYQEPTFIERIENRDGEVLWTSAPEAERVLSEEVAAQVTEMMRGVVDRGTGRAVRTGWGVNADVAGKTGTTQGNADGWFLLVHPQLVAGAWAGFNDPRVAFRSNHWGQGGNNALRVVAHFFQQALRGGALSPEEELMPSPEVEDAGEGGGSFFAQVGDAIGSAAQGVGRAMASAASSAGGAVAGAVGDWLGGGDDESPPVAQQDERAGDRSSGRDGDREGGGRSERSADGSAQEEEGDASPRTWNETADERRRRMERYWKELQEERRREVQRRRERLEEYYEEVQDDVEETAPDGRAPDSRAGEGETDGSEAGRRAREREREARREQQTERRRDSTRNRRAEQERAERDSAPNEERRREGDRPPTQRDTTAAPADTTAKEGARTGW
jgi:penicillin-binding protein 1A